MGSEERPRETWRRRAGWGVTAAVILVVFAGGWLAASHFESPAQRAARAKAPEPSTITARVSSGDLSYEVNANAVVGRAVEQSIRLESSTQPSVVTAEPLAPGTAIVAGTVVAEINGRPVIAVPGSFRLYRDLTLGDTGPDVAQLQRGLTAAGHQVGDDGAFGPGTARALRALYSGTGYAPATLSPSPTPENGVDWPNPGAATASAVQAQVIGRMSEFAVIGAVPSYLVSSPAVNTELSDEAQLVVEAGNTTATALVADSVASAITLGMTGSVIGPGDAAIEITIRNVAEPDKGSQVRVMMAGIGDPIPESWIRKPVRARIIIKKAATDSLLVPTAAIATKGNDNPRVLKQQPDGTFREIEVREIAQLAGRSAVTLVHPDDALVAGDLVKVR